MKQRRTQPEFTSELTEEPASVRFVIAFNETLEALVGFVIRRIGDLFDRNRRPALQPVRVRSRRTYSRYQR